MMKMAGWMAVAVLSAATMFAQTAQAPATTDNGTANTHAMCARDKDGNMAHCKKNKDGKMSKDMSGKKCMCNHQKQGTEKKS